MNTIPLMDAAFQTLRALPAMAWLWWSSASLPFALTLIAFITEMGNSADASENLPVRSLTLGLLYLWLGAGQNIFCLYLRSSICGEPAPEIRLWRVLRGTGFLQSTSLVLLPLGVLSLLGGSLVFAFYQSAWAFADPSATTRQRASYGLREAMRQPKQAFAAFWLLAGMAFVVCINAAAIVFGGPFLLRMLTGQETAFTRSPVAMLNGATFSAVLAITWLCMDPVVKAVYVHRCFAADSLQTGGDLKAALRSIATVAASIVLLCSTAVGQVAPAEVDRAVREVSKRPEYVWRSPRALDLPSSENAFVRFTEDVFRPLSEMLQSAGRAVANGLEQLLKWIFNDPVVPVTPGAGAGGSEAAGVVIVIVLVLLAGVLAFFVLRLRRKIAEPVEAQPAPAGTIDLSSEEVSPALLEGDEWLSMADGYVRQGDYRMAARAVFLSLLASLGKRELIGIHRAKSNLEYARELARRTRGRDDLHAAFRSIVASFERTWYGGHEFTPDVFEDYRTRALTARQLAE